MTSRDFCYWLQGYIEIFESDTNVPEHGLHPKQLECVRRHLAMVFKHEIDPSFGGPEKQKPLDEIHSGPAKHWTNPENPIARC